MRKLVILLAALGAPVILMQAQAPPASWCTPQNACTYSLPQKPATTLNAIGTFGANTAVPTGATSVTVTLVPDTVTSAYTVALQTAPIPASGAPSYTSCATGTLAANPTAPLVLTCTASSTTGGWSYMQVVTSGGSAAGGYHLQFSAVLPGSFARNASQPPIAAKSFTNAASAALPNLTFSPGHNYELIIHITSTSFTSGTPGFLGLQFCTTDPTCASAVTTGYNGDGSVAGLGTGVTAWGGWNSAPVFCVYPVKASGSTCANDSFATTYPNALTFYVTFQDPGNTSSNKTATVQGVYSDSSALFTSVTGGYYWSNSAGTLPAVTGMTLVSYVGGSPGGTMTGTMTLVNAN